MHETLTGVGFGRIIYAESYSKNVEIVSVTWILIIQVAKNPGPKIISNSEIFVLITSFNIFVPCLIMSYSLDILVIYYRFDFSLPNVLELGLLILCDNLQRTPLVHAHSSFTCVVNYLLYLANLTQHALRYCHLKLIYVSVWLEDKDIQRKSLHLILDQHKSWTLSLKWLVLYLFVPHKPPSFLFRFYMNWSPYLKVFAHSMVYLWIMHCPLNYQRVHVCNSFCWIAWYLPSS